MNKKSGVANLLNISNEEAAIYCEKIRRLSGLKNRLPYKVIAHYVAGNLSDPSLHHIAEIIKAKKDEIIQPQEILENINKANQYKLDAKRKFLSQSRPLELNVGGILEDNDSTKPINGLVRTSHLDHERVLEEKLDHCLHGVLRIRPCAICDPKKFREMTGID